MRAYKVDQNTPTMALGDVRFVWRTRPTFKWPMFVDDGSHPRERFLALTVPLHASATVSLVDETLWDMGEHQCRAPREDWHSCIKFAKMEGGLLRFDARTGKPTISHISNNHPLWTLRRIGKQKRIVVVKVITSSEHQRLHRIECREARALRYWRWKMRDATDDRMARGIFSELVNDAMAALRLQKYAMHDGRQRTLQQCWRRRPHSGAGVAPST